MVDFKAFIFYVNRDDLLEKAYRSVVDSWDENLFIVDNSPDRNLSYKYAPNRLLYPSIPLTFSQTQNYCRKIAMYEKLDFFITMHNDAQMSEGDAGKLIEFIEKLSEENPKWGVVFTFYDTVIAFNTKMVTRMEPWDIVMPQYFSDNDYYRRVRLAGWHTVESEIKVKHESSATLSDPVRQYYHLQSIEMYRGYYIRKWGGPPGSEQFIYPFNQKELAL